MNALKGILSLCALILAGLAGWLAWKPQTHTALPMVESPPTPEQAPTPITPPTPETPSNKLDWANIESTDFKVYIANLRKVGCPEQTVRDIVIADINKIFAPRESPFKNPVGEQAAKLAPLPWERGIKSAASSTAEERKRDFERRRQLRVVQQEKSHLIRELLGFEIPLDILAGWSGRNVERMTAALDALPPEKRERAREVQENYWIAVDELNDRSRNKRGEAYMKDYNALTSDRLNRLNQVLSPAELLDLEMRTSTMGQKLGTQLADFKPTDDEYRTLFQMRRELDEPFGGSLQANQVEGYDAEKIKAREVEIATKLKDYFGPERYAQFEKAQDPAWQQLRKMETRFGWEAGKADEVYSEQKALREGIRDMQAMLNPKQDPGAVRSSNPGEDATPKSLQDRAAQLQESMLRLSQKMGNDAWSVFQVRNGDIGVPDIQVNGVPIPGKPVRTFSRPTP